MRSSNLPFAGSLLAAAVVSADNTTVDDLSTNATCACTQLASTYGDLVLFSNSTNYAAEATDYWDIRADLLPGCIFMPKEADQVANAVSIFTSCSAQFAIRGGGHMNVPGSNNIDGGVLLALNNLTDISVDTDAVTVEAGPGLRWSDVYEALGEHGLYCVGGRLKTIGVPGLSLIGGFHYFNNKYGMAMDNVISYDVVLGNGTQVVANATSNPDLFWALKGGANNFGIVTKFTLKAYHHALVSTSIQVFTEDAVPDFITATVDLAINDSPDIAAGAVIFIYYNTALDTAIPLLLGVQEGIEVPPSRFANFSAIPHLVALNLVQTPTAYHSLLDTPFQEFRVQFAHKTMKPDSDQLYSMYQAWKTSLEDIKDVAGLLPTFVMNILPASALSVAKNNDIGNTWGFDDDQPYILWQFSTSWDNATDDERVTTWATNLLDSLHQQNQDKGLASEFIYMGDAGDFQDPFAGLPTENVQRMKEIQNSYDPQGVFTYLNQGGFKLSN